jgi:hypothetical protein
VAQIQVSYATSLKPFDVYLKYQCLVNLHSSITSHTHVVLGLRRIVSKITSIHGLVWEYHPLTETINPSDI